MRSLPELLFGVGNGDFSKIFLAVFISIALGFLFFLRRVIVSLNPHRPLEQQQNPNPNRNHHQQPESQPHSASRFNLREEAMDLIMLCEVTYSWIDPCDVARLTLPEFLYITFFVFVKWKQRLLARAVNAEIAAYNSNNNTTMTENRGLRRSARARARARTRTRGRGRSLDNDDEVATAAAANAMNNAAAMVPQQQQQQQCLYRSRLLRDEPTTTTTHIPVRKRRGRDKTTAPMRARLVRTRAAAKLFEEPSPPVPSVSPVADGREEDE